MLQPDASPEKAGESGGRERVCEAAVASWMADQVRVSGYLERRFAALEIQRRFGPTFVRVTPGGGWSISEPVLEAFRALTAEQVVWERGRGLWRRRMPEDPPSRDAPWR